MATLLPNTAKIWSTFTPARNIKLRKCSCLNFCQVMKNSHESLDLESAYAELNLKHIQDQVGGVRVRQHVNPLNSACCKPAIVPDWAQVFADPTLPLHLDIGCGSGRYLLLLAKRNLGTQNFLGLEIREKLVERAEGWREELGLPNVHFLFANANASLPGLLDSYPGKIVYTTILCPDPHFKNRHKKRRVVQPALVEALSKLLVRGGKLLVASDVREVAEDMREQIETCGAQEFEKSENHSIDGWLSESPLGVPTEREFAVLSRGDSMYRTLYQKL